MDLNFRTVHPNTAPARMGRNQSQDNQSPQALRSTAPALLSLFKEAQNKGVSSRKRRVGAITPLTLLALERRLSLVTAPSVLIKCREGRSLTPRMQTLWHQLPNQRKWEAVTALVCEPKRKLIIKHRECPFQSSAGSTAFVGQVEVGQTT